LKVVMDPSAGHRDALPTSGVARIRYGGKGKGGRIRDADHKNAGHGDALPIRRVARFRYGGEEERNAGHRDALSTEKSAGIDL
jgi:hypothetical protein